MIDPALHNDLFSFQADLASVIKKIKEAYAEKKNLELEIKILQEERIKQRELCEIQLETLEKDRARRVGEINDYIREKEPLKRIADEEIEKLNLEKDGLRSQIRGFEEVARLQKLSLSKLLADENVIKSAIGNLQCELRELESKAVQKRLLKEEVAQLAKDKMVVLQEVGDIKSRATALDEREKCIINREAEITPREQRLYEREGAMADNEERIAFIYKKLTEKIK